MEVLVGLHADEVLDVRVCQGLGELVADAVPDGSVAAAVKAPLAVATRVDRSAVRELVEQVAVVAAV